MNNPSIFKRCVVEIVGTALLTLVLAVGISTVSLLNTGQLALNCAIITGLAYFLIGLCFENFNVFGYFNPVLVLFDYLKKRVTLSVFALCTLFEILGALIGAFIFRLIMPISVGFQPEKWFTQLVPGFGSSSPSAKSLSTVGINFDIIFTSVLELVLAALVILIFNYASGKKLSVPMKWTLIASGYALSAYLLSLTTAGGANIAKNIALSVASLNIDSIAQLWLFVLTPVLAVFLVSMATKASPVMSARAQSNLLAQPLASTPAPAQPTALEIAQSTSLVTANEPPVIADLPHEPQTAPSTPSTPTATHPVTNDTPAPVQSAPTVSNAEPTAPVIPSLTHNLTQPSATTTESEPAPAQPTLPVNAGNLPFTAGMARNIVQPRVPAPASAQPIEPAPAPVIAQSTSLVTANEPPVISDLTRKPQSAPTVSNAEPAAPVIPSITHNLTQPSATTTESEPAPASALAQTFLNTSDEPPSTQESTAKNDTAQDKKEVTPSDPNERTSISDDLSKQFNLIMESIESIGKQ
ncbi:MAG: hypothetical protein LBQ41_00945 [Candidatus Ancillula sp.]|jgi:glycerol uptake facilitator-like aquaporin|nr:hypothetical protein [Candidatus Ancillula sp.]